VDWKPVEEPPQPAPEPAPEPEPEPKPKKAPRKEPKPAPPATYVEPVTSLRGTGMLRTPGDPLLASARTELSRSNIPAALDAYGKLIKKGRYLEEVIYDLREALYRYPVEVSIWQALGDAYMRANQLQDALDAYTKAEELLR
jgi:tetratricopeptide (TPR) repeat protein